LVVIVQEELRQFAKGIEAKLKEIGFDPQITPIVKKTEDKKWSGCFFMGER